MSKKRLKVDTCKYQKVRKKRTGIYGSRKGDEWFFVSLFFFISYSYEEKN